MALSINGVGPIRFDAKKKRYIWGRLGSAAQLARAEMLLKQMGGTQISGSKKGAKGSGVNAPRTKLYFVAKRPVVFPSYKKFTTGKIEGFDETFAQELGKIHGQRIDARRIK